MVQTITAVIPAKNEEQNIVRCIQSLDFCDKVILMWMGNDRTGEIAKNLGAEVIKRNQSMKDDFVGVQKNINWAIDNIKTDWILRIDADEAVSDMLKKEIKEILENEEQQKYVAYGVPRSQYFLGGFLKGGDWAYDRLVRLFKPKHARYEPLVEVHEQFKVNGPIGHLTNPLLHYSHPTLHVLLKKFNSYTDLQINDINESTPRAVLNMIIQPPYVFARWMIWHLGIRDGWRGFVAGALRGYYEFLLYKKYILKKKLRV